MLICGLDFKCNVLPLSKTVKLIRKWLILKSQKSQTSCISSYLQSGHFQSGWRCWHYCRLPCHPEGRGGAVAHPVKVYNVDPGRSPECRPHMVLQWPERWNLNLQPADSVWTLVYKWDILWTVWSASLSLIKQAAGGPAPECLNTEASHSESGPLISDNSPASKQLTCWLRT